MSNLGGYQTIVEAVKRLGGPVKALTIVVGGSFTLGAAAYAGGQKVVGKVRDKREEKARRIQTYVVTADGEDDQGLKLSVGDEYRVLERDDDAVLVEAVGRNGNPYMVSADFLRSISDFPSDAGQE